VAVQSWVVGFNHGLWKFDCPECGERVEWQAAFDADGTTYYGQCACELDEPTYTMRTSVVKIERMEND
jgi:predicted RNA-binding Zn-ribbon protein involved in translation (DUF1610 family)